MKSLYYLFHHGAVIFNFAVSVSLVAGAAYLYINKDVLIEKARERATEEITSAVGAALTSASFGLGETELTPEVPTELPIKPPSGFSF